MQPTLHSHLLPRLLRKNNNHRASTKLTTTNGQPPTCVQAIQSSKAPKPSIPQYVVLCETLPHVARPASLRCNRADLTSRTTRPLRSHDRWRPRLQAPTSHPARASPPVSYNPNSLHPAARAVQAPCTLCRGGTCTRTPARPRNACTRARPCWLVHQYQRIAITWLAQYKCSPAQCGYMSCVGHVTWRRRKSPFTRTQ